MVLKRTLQSRSRLPRFNLITLNCLISCSLDVTPSRFQTFPALTSYFKQINSQILIRLRADKAQYI